MNEKVFLKVGEGEYTALDIITDVKFKANHEGWRNIKNGELQMYTLDTALDFLEGEELIEAMRKKGFEPAVFSTLQAWRDNDLVISVNGELADSIHTVIKGHTANIRFSPPYWVNNVPPGSLNSEVVDVEAKKKKNG